MNYFNGKKILHVVKKEDTPLNLQEKTITPQNQTPVILPDSGYVGLSKVKLNGILVDIHHSYTSQTDNSVAYQKTIPTGALMYGELGYIGGASKVSKNLIPDIQPIVREYAKNNSGFDLTPYLQNGKTYYIKGNLSQTYTSADPNNRNFVILAFDNNDNITSIQGFGNDVQTTINYSFTADLTTYVKYYLTLATNNNGHNLTIDNLILSTSDVPYEPYFENIRSAKTTSVVVSGTDVAPITKAIPQEVLNDVRYGLGFSDTQFNKLDLITKHLTGEWNIVDLGSLDWNYNPSYGTTAQGAFYCPTDIGAKQVANDKTFNGNCAKYEATSRDYVWYNQTDKKICLTGGILVTVVDKDYTDAQAFKQAMSGVYLLYQTATQFDVDFSQYIDDDFKTIDITNMTTATFENEFGYDVPSEITYLIET